MPSHILVVEDERDLHARPDLQLQAGRLRRRLGARRRDRAPRREGGALRSRPARPDAPRHARDRGLPAPQAEPGDRRHPRRDGDRQGRGGRPHRRLRARRRRLRGQALQRARADPPRARDPPPRRGPRRGRGALHLRPPRRSTAPPTAPGSTAQEVAFTALELRLLTMLLRPARPGAHARSAARRGLGVPRRRHERATSTRTSSACARSSAPPASTSRRCAASATASAPSRSTSRRRSGPSPPEACHASRPPPACPARLARGRRSAARATGRHPRVTASRLVALVGAHLVGLASPRVPAQAHALALATGAAAGAAIAAGAAAVYFLRPLRASRLARDVAGDLAAAPRRGDDEVADLARALNRRRERRTPAPSTRSRGERDLFAGVLDGMGEGVLVLDADERIVLANRALRDHGPARRGRPRQAAARGHPQRGPEGGARRAARGSGVRRARDRARPPPAPQAARRASRASPHGNGRGAARSPSSTT